MSAGNMRAVKVVGNSLFLSSFIHYIPLYTGCVGDSDKLKTQWSLYLQDLSAVGSRVHDALVCGHNVNLGNK